MLENTAYLLVYHGSRDPRPHQEVSWLAQQVRQKLEVGGVASTKRESAAVLTQPPQPLVYTAALELAELSLEDAIAQIGSQIIAKGITCLKVMPLFLLPGVHVREDIPSAIAQASQQLSPQLQIQLTSYLGESCLMAQQLTNSTVDPVRLKTTWPQSATIIVSHGSRRKGGNRPILQLANQLGATTAYWSVSPTLHEQIATLVEQGKQAIYILPYFLFPGGITDAIAQEVEWLKQQFPSVQLEVGPPLSRCISLTEVIIHELSYDSSTTAW